MIITERDAIEGQKVLVQSTVGDRNIYDGCVLHHYRGVVTVSFRIDALTPITECFRCKDGRRIRRNGASTYPSTGYQLLGAVKDLEVA